MYAEYVVCGGEYMRHLTNAVQAAEPGDVILVESEALFELAQRALGRMGKSNEVRLDKSLREEFPDPNFDESEYE